jgi:hypothetical protein
VTQASNPSSSIETSIRRGGVDSSPSCLVTQPHTIPTNPPRSPRSPLAPAKPAKKNRALSSNTSHQSVVPIRSLVPRSPRLNLSTAPTYRGKYPPLTPGPLNIENVAESALRSANHRLKISAWGACVYLPSHSRVLGWPDYPLLIRSHAGVAIREEAEATLFAVLPGEQRADGNRRHFCKVTFHPLLTHNLFPFARRQRKEVRERFQRLL